MGLFDNIKDVARDVFETIKDVVVKVVEVGAVVQKVSAPFKIDILDIVNVVVTLKDKVEQEIEDIKDSETTQKVIDTITELTNKARNVLELEKANLPATLFNREIGLMRNGTRIVWSNVARGGNLQWNAIIKWWDSTGSGHEQVVNFSSNALYMQMYHDGVLIYEGPVSTTYEFNWPDSNIETPVIKIVVSSKRDTSPIPDLDEKRTQLEIAANETGGEVEEKDRFDLLSQSLAAVGRGEFDLAVDLFNEATTFEQLIDPETDELLQNTILMAMPATKVTKLKGIVKPSILTRITSFLSSAWTKTTAAVTAAKAAAIATAGGVVTVLFKDSAGKISTKAIAKTGLGVGGTLAGIDVLATWLASDNVITGAGFSIRNLKTAVKEGVMTKEEALTHVTKVEGWVEDAVAFVDKSVRFNPTLIVFKTPFLINNEKGLHDIAIEKRLLENMGKDDEIKELKRKKTELIKAFDLKWTTKEIARLKEDRARWNKEEKIELLEDEIKLDEDKSSIDVEIKLKGG